MEKKKSELEIFIGEYCSYKDLLASCIDEIKTGSAKTLGLASRALLDDLMPNEETEKMQDDTVQCFYFLSIISAIKGYTKLMTFSYLESKYELLLDEFNKEAVRKGAEKLRDANYFQSYIWLLKTTGVWKELPGLSRVNFNLFYNGTKTTGCIKDFKYDDHPLIKKVLGPDYSTQAV